MHNKSWIFYTFLLVLFWGVWGAFSGLPTEKYGYPDQMVYIIWAITMLIPAYAALRRESFDRRGIAALYGLAIGLTGAGGQLLLFKALTVGPPYLIFPVISISPAITVIMAFVLLRERITPLGGLGILSALIAIVMFSLPSEVSGGTHYGPWLLLASIICICWGVQAFLMKRASLAGVNDGTTFAWMTISGFLLIPVAFWMMPGSAFGFPWQAPALTTITQLLNAFGALFLVMALSRGKAVIVAPCTNALAPVLTIVLSLTFYGVLPSLYSFIGIVLALVGSTLMVYSEEKEPLPTKA
ncbi:DMT family transporter [Halomonas sp. HP20-15]|uniref:DMT family transporter n=1 Tax=Halomonas sp. HP20-15 TaxID=3085901 RepID=UPI00298222D3|nr:DMT family transporter [Halomonas sp. HP20-15]MDW5377525.1 DMT family transporter [Halomonas sp. HP20-15]